MAAPPRDISEWLPAEIPAGEIEAWALLGRSFDRVSGEALVVRLRTGATALLTRPELFEFFRALPTAVAQPLRLVEAGTEPHLQARMIDGRLLTLPLTPMETAQVRDVLGREGVGTEGVRTPPPGAPGSDRPRSASLRPPESAETEIVRVPRTVRPAATHSGTPIPPRPSGTPVPRPGTPIPPPRASGTPLPARRSPLPPLPPLPAVPPRASPQPAKRSSYPPAPTPPVRARAAELESLHPPVFAPEPAPIVRSARDVDALRARFRYHFEEGQLDEASQVGRALVHLGIADAMERRLAQLQPEAPPSFASALTPYLFRAYLAHDEEDTDLGRVLASIWPAFLQMRARPERELGLRPKDEVEFASTAEPFARLFAHGARAFGLDVPRLFLRTDVPGGMAHLHTMPIASLCGGTLATGFDAPSTLHVLGSHLSLYRPEVYLVALAPAPQDLNALLLAALQLEGKLRPLDARIGGLADTLARHMVPPVRDALRNACADLQVGGSDPHSAAIELLRKTRRAAYLTAVRAGFALSGSLAVSDRMQRIMPAIPGLTMDEIVDDLVTYSVSPSWMALRRELGISIEPSAAKPPPAAS